MTFKYIHTFILLAVFLPALAFGQPADPNAPQDENDADVAQATPTTPPTQPIPPTPVVTPAPTTTQVTEPEAQAQSQTVPIPKLTSTNAHKVPLRLPRQTPSLKRESPQGTPTSRTGPPVPGAPRGRGPGGPPPGAPGNPGGPGADADENSPDAIRLGSTNTLANLVPDKNGMIERWNFVGMPVEQVLDIYSDLVKRTLLRAITGPAAIPDPEKNKITLKTKEPMTKAEAIMALETVLAMNGITIIPIGDKFAKVVTEIAAPQAGAAFSTNDSKHLPEMGRYITQVVQFKYVSAEDLISVLQPFAKSKDSLIAIKNSQTLVIRDYTENVKRMLEIVEKVDVPSTQEVKPEVIKIKFALASDIQQVLSSLSQGGGGGVSIGRSSSSGSGTFGSSGFGSSSTGLNSGTYGSSGYNNRSGLNSSTTGGLNGTTGGLSSGGSGARNNFAKNLNSIISKAAGTGDFQVLGNAKIIADERTNSLLVFANKDDMEMIKVIIEKLDVVLAQVLIEAIIMEVTLGDTKDIGISYLQHAKKYGDVSTIGGLNNSSSANSFYEGLSNSSNTNGLGDLTSGFSYFTSINKDLDVVMTAVKTDSRVNVLSRPRIQTSHAVQASLFVGQTVPYVTGTYYGGSAYGNSANYQQLSVGIELDVLPLINPDGLVVMDIQQNIEQIGGYVTISDNQVPKTTKRQAQAKVAVHDRETIMLGGFISNSKTVSHSGVPWLMDIPLLGALFRSHSDTGDKTELIVLIRPTVLPTPASAAAFASEERDKMAGVKKAEIEIREDELKNNEEANKDLKREEAKKAKKAKSADISTNQPSSHWFDE